MDEGEGEEKEKEGAEVVSSFVFQRVIFNIVNFSKTKSLYRDGMSPVVKSTSRPKWQRLPAKNVYYYRCPDHRRNYVMSFAFCFDREDDVYQFAYCYPYTYSRLQHYLASLERRNLPYLQREQLGLSVVSWEVKSAVSRWRGKCVRGGNGYGWSRGVEWWRRLEVEGL
uniref:AGBL carboxypeptidase 4 n=1 Tax=Acanthochromis polyacanthus TaxID=80966 RepID=A0A3Q1G6E5_9TELE